MFLNWYAIRRMFPLALAGSLGLAAVVVAALHTPDASAQMKNNAGAVIRADGSTSIPGGFREWVFLGAPLTPNGLNDGQAGFPEFHHVYIEPGAYTEYKRTGTFPEGTTIVKELVLLKEAEFEDGSRFEPSGRGFFADRVAGIDMMVKDSKRFPESNGWGFYNFGHHEPPYAESSSPAPVANCAGCHEANATYDMMFTTFYPILGRK